MMYVDHSLSFFLLHVRLLGICSLRFPCSLFTHLCLFCGYVCKRQTKDRINGSRVRVSEISMLLFTTALTCDTSPLNSVYHILLIWPLPTLLMRQKPRENAKYERKGRYSRNSLQKTHQTVLSVILVCQLNIEVSFKGSWRDRLSSMILILFKRLIKSCLS